MATFQRQVTGETSAAETEKQETSCLQQRCVQYEQQLLQVQEDTERLQHLQQVKQKQVDELERQQKDDVELVAGLLDQTSRLDEEALVILRLSALDGSQLEVAHRVEGHRVEGTLSGQA